MRSAIIGLAMGLMAGFAAAQAPEMPGHVRLRVLPDIAKLVEALPRVVGNAAVTVEVAEKRNARFAKLDRDTRSAAAECRNSLGERGDFQQTVNVTMRGPRYLALDVEDSYDCGGPHPENSTQGLVYDVTTGEPVDWTAVLPGSKKGYPARDGSGAALVIWPELQRRALEAADAECKQLYRYPGMQFIVWLDGDAGAVVAEAGGLTHIDSATCSVQVQLDVASLRKLRADAKVIDALDAAAKEQTPEAVKRRANRAHRKE